MGKAARYGMALALVAVVATGCLRGDVDVVVRDDGSGELTLDLEPLGQLATLLADIDVQSLADARLEGVDGAEFEATTEGGNPEYRLRVPFEDPEQLNSLLVDGVTIAGLQVRLLDSLEIAEVDGNWRLDAVLAPQVAPVAAGDAGELESILSDPAQLLVGSLVELSIALPGSVAQTNADERSGGTATWSLDGSEGSERLTMANEPTTFPTTVQLVLIAGGAAVLIGLVLALFSRRRSRARWSRRTIDLRVPPSSGPSVGDYTWTRPKESRPTGLVDLKPMPLRSESLPSIDGTTTASAAETPHAVDTRVGDATGTHEPDAAADGRREPGQVEVAEPASSELAPAGWYADPEGDGSRWWNGHEWTELRC